MLLAYWPTTGGVFFLAIILAMVLFSLLMASIGHALQLYVEVADWLYRRKLQRRLKDSAENPSTGAVRNHPASEPPRIEVSS